MSCKHEKLKSVNCHIYCQICGEELPIDYLVGKDRIKAQETAEKAVEPAEPVKKTTRRKKV